MQRLPEITKGMKISTELFAQIVASIAEIQDVVRSNKAHDTHNGQFQLIFNNTGTDLVAFNVVGIEGTYFTPADDEVSFQQDTPIFVGKLPDITKHTGKFAVLLQPVSDGQCGPAVVFGISVVKVKMPATVAAYKFAEIRDGDPTSLIAGNTGSTQLLWIDPTLAANAVGFGIVRVGSGLAASPLAVFKITASSQDGTNKRWAYTARKMKKTGAAYNGWAEVDGTNYTLYNTIEDQNAATGTYGNGVASSNLTGTFAIKPIPTGTRVFAQSVEVVGGTTEWWIANYVNGVDGGCS